MTTDIDAIVDAHVASEAQAQTAETKVEAKPDADGKPEALEAPKTDETIESTEESESKPDEPFPNKARNLLSRKDKKIGKLSATVEFERQQNQQLQQELAKYKTDNQSTQQTIDPNAPKLEGYKTWDEYTRALVKYEAKQEAAANNKQIQLTQNTQTQDVAKAERASEIATRTNEFIKQTPEYANLVKDNIDFFQNLSGELEAGLAQAENPTLALYAIMKEGNLDDLYDLSPMKLTAVLAKAEVRGESYLKQPKPTTNAPAPISAAKGNIGGSKPLTAMSFLELKKELNLK